MGRIAKGELPLIAAGRIGEPQLGIVSSVGAEHHLRAVRGKHRRVVPKRAGRKRTRRAYGVGGTDVETPNGSVAEIALHYEFPAVPRHRGADAPFAQSDQGNCFALSRREPPHHISLNSPESAEQQVPTGSPRRE